MARYSADGQDHNRAIALGTQAALSFACFFKLSVDRNDYSSLFFIDNGTSDNWGMQSGADGTTMSTVFDASTQEGMGSLAVGVWYWVMLATSGTTGFLYYKVVGAPTLTVQAVTSVTANVNAATLRIGESPWGAEWVNGCVAGPRLWLAQVGRAEAECESQQLLPMRSANIAGAWPLVRPDPLDYSGNGRTLGGGAGATYDDGPAVPLQRLVIARRWLSTAGTTTHSAAAAATASGSVTATGTSDKPAAASVAGAATLTATGASTKPAEASLTGTVAVTATADVTKHAAATLTAIGTFTSDAAANKPADAGIAGSGSVTAAAAGDKPTEASLHGTGATTAAAASTKPAEATLTGTGAVTGAGTATKPMDTALTGVAVITADAVVGAAPVTAVATLTGIGSLTTAAEREATSEAALTGLGTLTVSCLVVKPIGADLIGLGVLAVAGNKTVPAEAVLIGAATVAAGAHAQGQVTRGGSTLLDRTSPGAHGTTRTSAAANVLQRTGNTARGGT